MNKSHKNEPILLFDLCVVKDFSLSILDFGEKVIFATKAVAYRHT